MTYLFYINGCLETLRNNDYTVEKSDNIQFSTLSAAKISTVGGVGITHVSSADGGIQLMDIFIGQVIISCPPF